MVSENRLPVIIFSTLVAGVAGVVLAMKIVDISRPTLNRVVIVSATDDDPVFRTGTRILAPDDQVTLAVALQVNRLWGAARWYAPGPQLAIGNESIEPIVTTSWPEIDRELRVFWFSLQSSTMGGVQTEEGLQRVGELRPILAPEMGRGMVAVQEPDADTTEALAPLDGALSVKAGTYRLYARAEISTDGRLAALQTVASPGLDDPFDPNTLRISRRLDPMWGLEKGTGELFRLPSVEPPIGGSGQPDAIAHLVDRRLAVSSRAFALFASPLASQVVEPTPENIVNPPIGVLPTVSDTGEAILWSRDIQPGAVIRSDIHWLVVLRDDGNGQLDGPDLVAQAWRRPASILPLAAAVDEDEPPLHLVTPGMGRQKP